MPLQAATLQLGPWTDGVVYNRPAEDLPQTALYAMQNCVIGAGGELRKRNGYTTYVGTALTGTPTLTMATQHRFSSASTSTWIVAGAKIYECVAGAWVDRTGGLTVTSGEDNTFSIANAAGTLCMTNGVDAPICATAAASNATALDVDSRFTWSKWLAWWDNRLWHGNVSNSVRRVYRTDAGDITTVGATAFYTADGDITGLCGYRNILAVHTEDGIWCAYPTGDATAPYSWQKRTTKGTSAGRTVLVNAADEMLFVRKDGIYEWAPGQSDIPVKISAALDGSRYWDNVVKTRLPYAHAVEYPSQHEVWFWLPYGTGQVVMNHVMIWDYQARRWEGPLTAMERVCSALIDEVPHAGGHDTGLLYKHDYGENDNAAAIDAWAETASPAPAGTGAHCRWLLARHMVDTGNGIDLQVTQISPEIVSRTDAFTLGSGYDTIGITFRIAVSRIGAEDERRTSDTPLWGYAPSVMLRYRNANADQPFTIRHVQLYHKPIGYVNKEVAGIE